jgi:hypothetical protein
MDSSSSTRSAFEKRIDLRQDSRYKNFVKKIGFEIVSVPTSKGMAYGYIKYVPLIGVGLLKIQRYLGEIDQKRLTEVIKNKRIIRTILEPINNHRVLNRFTLNRDPFLPTKTRVIKIGGKHLDFSQNVQRISKKHNKITMGVCELDVFHNAWNKTSKIWTLSKSSLNHLKSEFGDDCILWTEKENDQIIGGVVCLICGEWAYYFAAFVSKEGRKENAGVHGVLGLIEYLKKREIKYLDFEGIYDERFPRNSWKGFSEFKSRFGGETIELPGCYARWF